MKIISKERVVCGYSENGEAVYKFIEVIFDEALQQTHCRLVAQ